MNVDFAALRKTLAELPNVKTGAPAFEWNDDLDAILREFWPKKRQSDVCKLIGCTANTARNRYRELTGSQ